jgi:glycosyltransferase involved in cell wall biosynthesis
MSKLILDLLGFERGKAFGYEEYVLNLLSDFKLYREKVKVDEILLVICDSQIEFFKMYFEDFFSLYSLPCNSIYQRLKLSRRIPKLLGLTGDDVILYTGNTMPLTGVMTKTLLVVHDLLFLHGDYFAHSLYNIAFRIHRYIYIPRSLKQADKIIAISNFTKSEIVDAYHVCPEKVRAVYNYFNFDKYQVMDDRMVPDIEGKYILTVCAGAKHKNQITMLKAFSKFAIQHNEYQFVLIGRLSEEGTKYLAQMDELIKQRVIVRHHLSNSDMKSMYEHASMYVAASLYEGLGMPVVEALYFGLPTILSNTAIHREVSLNQATYFAPLSADELCNCFESCMHKERRMDAEFRDELVTMYDSNHTSLKYIEEINSLLGGVKNQYK